MNPNYNTSGTLTQGQDFYQNGRNVGKVQFDTKTGRRLNVGETTNTDPNAVQNAPAFDYSSLNSDTLSPQTPFKLPDQQPQTEATGLGGYLSALGDNYKALNDQARQDRLGLESERAGIADTLTKLGLSGQRREALYQEGGVDEAKKAADEYQSQIDAERNALQNKKDALLSTPGMTRSQALNAFQEEERFSTSKQADLAILQATSQRRYETAAAIADRKLQAELEPLKVELQIRQLFYQDNKEQFNKTEQRAFEAGQSILKAQYEDYKETATFKSNVALEAAKYGATPSQLADIGNAKTKEQAIIASGKTLGRAFELQLRAQNFTETMAQKSYDLQSAQLEAQMQENINKANQEALLKFSDTTEAKAVTAIKGQVDQVNQSVIDNLQNVTDPKTGAVDYKKITDAQWKELSSNSSFTALVANAEMRARNPEITRLADSGDLAQEKALTSMIDQRIKELSGGSFGSVKNIKEAINATNSTLKSRMTAANTKLSQFKLAYPNATILDTYQQANNGVSLRDKLAQASKVGAQPQQIIDYLKNDPIIGPQITTGLNAGYTPLQIFQYLQSQ